MAVNGVRAMSDTPLGRILDARVVITATLPFVLSSVLTKGQYKVIVTAQKV
jgi:hypothetical protein